MSHPHASQFVEQQVKPKLQLSNAQKVHGAILKASWSSRQDAPHVLCCGVIYGTATEIDLVQDCCGLLAGDEDAETCMQVAKISGSDSIALGTYLVQNVEWTPCGTPEWVAAAAAAAVQQCSS
jgi:hypothetical protein